MREVMAECQRLRDENTRLRKLLGLPSETAASPTAPPATPPLPGPLTARSASGAKIALFRSLFRGREDVYAGRWSGRDGRSGYSPACRNEWDRGLCDKPRVRCSECPNRAFLQLTDQVIYDHLSGAQGIAPRPEIEVRLEGP